MSLRLAFLFLFFSFASCSQGKVESSSYNFMLNRILDRNVPEISVDSLKNNFNHFILLDSREKGEFDISHMKNAVHVGFDEFSLKSLPKAKKNQPIVVYCSVGYRSEKITQKLLKNGYSHVYNLYGGLFEWVNQENPVFINNQETKKIHAYSKVWGMWLNKGDKIYPD